MAEQQHPDAQQGMLQVAAVDEGNTSRFLDLAELREKLGVNDLEARVAKLEGPKRPARPGRG